jgi:hypothetical protein
VNELWAGVGAFIGLAGAGVGGFMLGRRFRETRSRRLFWLSCVLSFVFGVIFIFLGEMARIGFLAGGGVGFITGGLNGLRWGMGRLDDAPHPEVPQPSTAEAQREVPEHERRPEDHHPHPAT